MDSITGLLDFSRFMPHGMCYLWRWDLLALHVGSDMVIAGSYFSIPAAMVVLLRKRPDVPRGIFKLFVAFIMLCGITHLASILVTWVPLYYMEGLLKLATAAVSLTTAIILWPLIPKAIAMPSVQEMEIRNREIENLNTKLQQRIDSLSTLAGGVSHEFNNLLTIISGNAELLEMEAISPEHKSRLASIRKASDRATEVCSKMLAYSGHGHFILGEIDLNREIDSVTLRREDNCRVLYELDDNIGPVKASGQQIQQLVRYLYLNAKEAIEEQGRQDGEIKIVTRRHRLSREDLEHAAFEHHLEPGQVIILEMSDNGTGMTQAVRERIFEPYFTTRFTGRGLGLSAVQGIVRGHEACMFIDTPEGGGTTIRIAFPAVQAVSTLYKEPTNTNPDVILVVDDEEDILDLAKHYLSRLGKTVFIAKGAADALVIVDTHGKRIDTVILDYLMPDMSGIDLLEKIIARIRVDAYLTSGYTRGEITSPDIHRELTGFIAKPFLFEDFEKLFRPR